MNSQTKQCKNCQKDFTIEPDDFGFYEKIKVPPPTWCPECRLLRRISGQGYRALHKRKCDITGEDIISTIHQDSPFKVYKQSYWWSDKWDPLEYGKDYDFNRPFFEQFNELLHDVPMPTLMTEYTSLIGSEYCNAASELKNCYLCFKFDFSEECAYCNTGTKLQQCFDASFSNYSELLYESINATKCSRVFFSQDIEESHDIWFSQDLVGCSDCFGCINLRNKSYYIFNKPYSKEEYDKIISNYDFGSDESLKNIRKEVDSFFITQPRRQFHGYKNQDISGDYIYNSKNVKDSYMIRNAENLKYCQLLKAGPAKDSMDYTMFAVTAEWIYDSVWVGEFTSNVKFSNWCYKNNFIEYCFGCMSSDNLFGCVGLRSKKYCILNKQYSKEEYVNLMGRIKEQMQTMPYTDRQGREYRYGEFWPPEIQIWPYNDTCAYEWFPLDKDDAIAKGYSWRDEATREYRDATVKLPEHIQDIDDSIMKEILKCDDCGRNYQVIGKELQFLKRFGLAIPKNCPLCRDYSRTKKLNPFTIYDRKCDKCNLDIKTSYSTDRPEIVYCEQCYQQEVI